MRGSKIKDVEFDNIIEEVKRIKSRLCNNQNHNQNQKSLRNAKRELQRATAEVDYHLDIRNEQGRGGLMKTKSED